MQSPGLPSTGSKLAGCRRPLNCSHGMLPLKHQLHRPARLQQHPRAGHLHPALLPPLGRAAGLHRSRLWQLDQHPNLPLHLSGDLHLTFSPVTACCPALQSSSTLYGKQHTEARQNLGKCSTARHAVPCYLPAPAAAGSSCRRISADAMKLWLPCCRCSVTVQVSTQQWGSAPSFYNTVNAMVRNLGTAAVKTTWKLSLGSPAYKFVQQVCSLACAGCPCITACHLCRVACPARMAASAAGWEGLKVPLPAHIGIPCAAGQLWLKRLVNAAELELGRDSEGRGSCGYCRS